MIDYLHRILERDIIPFRSAIRILVFQTDLMDQKKVNIIGPVFDSIPGILDWNVDLEDKDKVLRIEADEQIRESSIISLLLDKGYYCNRLTS